MTKLVDNAGVAPILPHIVFLVVDEVPSVDKVVSKVVHTRSVQTDGDIRPAHPG